MHKGHVIPVALFAYARPDHLIKTLEGLHENNVPLIYAFCDGTKGETKDEKVKTVRQIIRQVAWTKVIITERETNLGLGTNIRDGVTQVLARHDKVIVIEDDIVMRPGAYKFTCDALNYYENDDRVMTVSMWNHPILIPRDAKNGFFSERFMCWGWGTYKKYWELYKESIDAIYRSLSVNDKNRIAKYGKDIFIQVEYSKKSNIWYVGYAMLHFKLEKLSYFPEETLIVNIGKDKTATNDGPGGSSYTEDFDLIEKPISIKGKNFPHIQILKNTKKNFNRYFYLKHPTYILLWYRAKRIVYKIFFG